MGWASWDPPCLVPCPLCLVSCLTHMSPKSGEGSWHTGASGQVYPSCSSLLRQLGCEGRWLWQKRCSQRGSIPRRRRPELQLPTPNPWLMWNEQTKWVSACLTLVNKLKRREAEDDQTRDANKGICQNPTLGEGCPVANLFLILFLLRLLGQWLRTPPSNKVTNSRGKAALTVVKSMLPDGCTENSKNIPQYKELKNLWV